MESGLRATTTQLEDGQRRFALRLLSLPHGDQVRKIVGAPTAIERRLTNALAYAGKTESIVLLEEPETLDAELLQGKEDETKAEAEKARPGPTMFTDGSRLEDGGWSYWLRGGVEERPILGGHQNPHGLQQGSLRRRVRRPCESTGIGIPKTNNPGTGHDFHGCPSCHQTDGIGGTWSQPAVCAPDEKVHCGGLDRASSLRSRWCPVHKGVAGNEKANEWAKFAAEEPDAHAGVECLNYVPGPGRGTRDTAPKIPRTPQAGCGGAPLGWRPDFQVEIEDAGGGQKSDGTAAGRTKRLASRFYQIKTGHCLTGEYLHWAKDRPTPQCWWCRYQNQTREHLFKVCPEWKAQQKILWAEVWKETGKWKSR